MSHEDDVTIVFLTYERTPYALRTIESTRRNLKGANFHWFVGDDGSSGDHLKAVESALSGEQIIEISSFRHSYGASANRGWRAANEIGPLTFWLEDDWELEREFDLSRYIKLLKSNLDIGMVRLGYLNINMYGKSFGHEGSMYWLLNRAADSYVFTGHPSLRHRRFFDAYGNYPEGLKPGETELSMALQFRTSAGPAIVWPAALGEYGVFGHIGTELSYVR